jgi:hypothetical protein
VNSVAAETWDLGHMLNVKCGDVVPGGQASFSSKERRAKHVNV